MYFCCITLCLSAIRTNLFNVIVSRSGAEIHRNRIYLGLYMKLQYDVNIEHPTPSKKFFFFCIERYYLDQTHQTLNEVLGAYLSHESVYSIHFRSHSAITRFFFFVKLYEDSRVFHMDLQINERSFLTLSVHAILACQLLQSIRENSHVVFRLALQTLHRIHSNSYSYFCDV